MKNSSNHVFWLQILNYETCLLQIFHHPMTTRWINPSDCVDMDCDARRKVLLTNNDGTFFGEVSVSAISQSEFGWGGDRKWGLSKYR